MKKQFTFFCFSLLTSVLYAQTEYNRNSLTVVAIDFKEPQNNRVFSGLNKLKAPDKYYDNNLKNRLLQTGVSRKPMAEGVPFVMQNIPDSDLTKWLKDNKIGQQILSIWFNRQADGSFNVDALKERGMYNANDNELMLAAASKRGTATLMDMGLKLVNQSYVLVFDFYDVMTMDEYYAKAKTPEKERTSNGYKAEAKGYLYKLDFDEAVASHFFQNYWTTPDDPKKNDKVKAFEEATFSFQAVSVQYAQLSMTQYNPKVPNAPKNQKTSEELLNELAQAALDQNLLNLEYRNKDFRVKAMVSGIKPIAVKIGKKEGLGFDQRYFVYENHMSKDGSVHADRVGVVKSMKVVDNRHVTSGETEPSLFYQIAGRKIDNVGMYLEQRNDLGFNLFLGSTFQGMTGFTGRLELYFSKLMGDLVGKGKSGRGLTAWKIYVEGAYGEKSYSPDSSPENFAFTRFSAGINKDYHPLRFLHWGPFIGYSLESANVKGSQIEVETDFVEAGARLGINLSHKVQLVGSATYNWMLGSKVLDKSLDKDAQVINKNFDYQSVFKDRLGISSSVGLRIMF